MSYETGDINSNAKGSGARANGGKVSLSLLPFHLMAGMARVLMAGTLKYKAWNWTKGMKWSVCMDCLLRHLFKWWYTGEECDPETGEHHLDHVLSNVLFLKHYLKAYPEGDDRPPFETDFALWLDDVNTPFDKAAYLARNPAVAEMLDKQSPDPNADVDGSPEDDEKGNPEADEKPRHARMFVSGLGISPELASLLAESRRQIREQAERSKRGEDAVPSDQFPIFPLGCSTMVANEFIAGLDTAKLNEINNRCCGANQGCDVCMEHCDVCPQPEGCKPGECLKAAAVDIAMGDINELVWDELSEDKQAAIIAVNELAKRHTYEMEKAMDKLLKGLNSNEI